MNWDSSFYCFFDYLLWFWSAVFDLAYLWQVSFSRYFQQGNSNIRFIGVLPKEIPITCFRFYAVEKKIGRTEDKRARRNIKSPRAIIFHFSSVGCSMSSAAKRRTTCDLPSKSPLYNVPFLWEQFNRQHKPRVSKWKTALVVHDSLTFSLVELDINSTMRCFSIIIVSLWKCVFVQWAFFGLFSILCSLFCSLFYSCRISKIKH